MIMLWWKPVVVALLSIGSMKVIVKKNQDKVDAFIMGIVRDIGRHKAKQRRHGNGKNNKHGLIMYLLKQDNPLEDLYYLQKQGENDYDHEQEDESNLPLYTNEELLEMGDGLDDRPILISIFGRVYNVSQGNKFYGPGGPYHAFAGHDITYSLSTGCRSDECISLTSEDLTEKERLEGKRWLSFFHWHDKYPLVGKLESDFLELLMKDLMDENDKPSSAGDLKPPIFQTTMN
jgi:predicted heme/steroid binding protein